MLPVLLRSARGAVAARRLLSSSPPKMISRYVLQYEYTPDVLEKRDPYRAGHLELIKEMAAEGHIMSAGAFADPVDGACPPPERRRCWSSSAAARRAAARRFLAFLPRAIVRCTK